MFNDHCAIESENLFSARLEVSMCQTAGAESYGPLVVSLNEGENRFLGDVNANPRFAKGSTHVYDVLIPGELRKIEKLAIRSESTNDEFCLSRVRLGVNHFTDTEGTAEWNWLFDTGPVPAQVNAGATLTYSFADLRANINWRHSNFTPIETIIGTGLDYKTLARMLETLIDGALQGQSVRWEDNPGGGELVSAEQGYGDHVGASEGDDACNIDPQETCGLDWSDPEAVCNVFPENMYCEADCDAYPDQWVCQWDWEGIGLNNTKPCAWRSGTCQFPSHADVHLDLEKSPHDLPKDAVHVSFMLKVSCSIDDNQLQLQPDGFHVNTGGFFGGALWERKVGDSIRGMAASFSQAVELPEDYTCAHFDPHFDRCGLWMGLFDGTRPAGLCQ